ncbi:hypothetical protein PgNI_05184 [Pyricularia grisea]|uniref:Uncharacterized protein n=1 Tax=Pyricularia grisea TaxID=148305 RepID=A0A6P8B5A6_PYRGI|nr:hypothetical protein PgNI_05184 [Pyricularia grisea]TLD10440.1 hypothetical protein PgNI_05184 [Pyricularia grisea]
MSSLLKLFRDDGGHVARTMKLLRQLSGEPIALLDWPSQEGVTVSIKTVHIDVRTNIFHSREKRRTGCWEFLVDWMADHGARKIVTSSRSVKSQVP